MQIFLSWSGRQSHAVALALQDFLRSVMQATKPWVSSEDIEKGARWSATVGQQLEEISFGIICLTPENIARPWINFEAGRWPSDWTRVASRPSCSGSPPPT